jgi:endonuclease/exonuclease/phosphatase family metal-dependent hydrolase
MLDFGAITREAGLRPLPVLERPGHAGWRSNVVLAREDVRILRGPTGLRLGGMEPRGAILAELDSGEGPFRLIACHLSLGAARRRAQAEAMLAAVAEGEPMPTLLLGDLNEWREAASALAVLRPVFGPACRVPTFPSFRPFLPLDHILGHPAGTVRDVTVHDTALARRASDHLPLTARFVP